MDGSQKSELREEAREKEPGRVSGEFFASGLRHSSWKVAQSSLLENQEGSLDCYLSKLLGQHHRPLAEQKVCSWKLEAEKSRTREGGYQEGVEPAEDSVTGYRHTVLLYLR